MANEDPKLHPGLDTNDKIVCLAEIAMSTPAGIAVTAGVPVKIAGTTAGVFETAGIAVTSQGRITYTGPDGIFVALFQAGIHATVQNTGNPITYLALNGSIIPGTRMRKTTNRSNETGSQSVNWALELTKGDFIEVWMDCAISDTFTAQTLVLTLLG